MNTIAVVAISIIPIAIFTQLKSQSRQYKQTPLSLKDLFLWAIICIAPPVSAFIQKPHVSLGIVIAIIFATVLVYGCKSEKKSEQIDPGAPNRYAIRGT
jgi:hypothetical protein